MPTCLITGASRGLGIEFARQYSAEGWQVHACARQGAGSAALAELAAASAGRITLHALDVEDLAAIEALAAGLAGQPLDVLINNAGTAGAKSFATAGMTAGRFGSTDYTDWQRTFRVNVQGPMKMAEAFVEHVAASEERKIVTLTSIMGSISSNGLGGMYPYRTTKAAANMLMRSLAVDLARRGIIALALHPGWARTDMGGPRAEVDVTTSVGGLRRVIAGATRAQSGHFLQWDGRELPW